MVLRVEVDWMFVSRKHVLSRDEVLEAEMVRRGGDLRTRFTLSPKSRPATI